MEQTNSCLRWKIFTEEFSILKNSEEHDVRVIPFAKKDRANPTSRIRLAMADIPIQTLEYLRSLLNDAIDAYIRKFVIIEFTNQLPHESTKDVIAIEKALYSSLVGLQAHVLLLLENLDHFEEMALFSDSYDVRIPKNKLRYNLKCKLRGVLLCSLPSNFEMSLKQIYKLSLNVHCNGCFTDITMAKIFEPFGSDFFQNVAHSDVLCEGCAYDADKCKCDLSKELTGKMNESLMKLDLLGTACTLVITEVVKERLNAFLDKNCKGNYDSSLLDSLENWLKNVILTWVRWIYSQPNCADYSPVKIREIMKMYSGTLYYHLYQAYTKMLLNHVFTIIIDYPDSMQVINDLKRCLAETRMEGELVDAAKKAFSRRLLQPSVNTSDILLAYIPAIRALRHIDPTGVLLELIAEDFRNYLRGRDDTIHCIVSSLTEDGCSYLAEEMTRPTQDYPNSQTGCGENHDADICDHNRGKDAWLSWQPQSIEIIPNVQPKRTRSLDIIMMLVSIFGSEQMFIDEYRKLLADKFLSTFTIDRERESTYLEILTNKFGDAELNKCEVMLKDIYDSTRINANLHSDSVYGLDKLPFSMRGVVLSSSYWPPFKENELKLPSIVKKHFKAFTKAYEVFRANRTLNWKPQLGLVKLDLKLESKTLSFTVSPLQATIIWHFQDKTEWDVNDLSEVTMVPASVLRKKMTFWICKGIIREVSADSFKLIEGQEEETNAKTPHMADGVSEDEDEESALASAQTQMRDELQIYWSYIFGMLTNLDSLPLQRIHQMLKIFAGQGSQEIDVTLPQLKAFLDVKIKEQLLTVSGGFYKLAKQS